MPRGGDSPVAGRASDNLQVSAVVAEVDNGVVLRHAFEEARLRGVPLRAVAVHAAETPDDVEQGSRLAHVHLSRRLAHWTRLYQVRVDRAIAGGSARARHLAANIMVKLFVADSHSTLQICGAYRMRRGDFGVACGSGSWEWCLGKGLLGR
ncbi:hypothetical protein ACQKB4_16710 [Mycobacterium tuberculosis]